MTRCMPSIKTFEKKISFSNIVYSSSSASLLQLSINSCPRASCHCRRRQRAPEPGRRSESRSAGVSGVPRQRSSLQVGREKGQRRRITDEVVPSSWRFYSSRPSQSASAPPPPAAWPGGHSSWASAVSWQHPRPDRSSPTTRRTKPARTGRRNTTSPSIRSAAPAAPQAHMSQWNAAAARTQCVPCAPKIPTTSTGTISPSASCAAPVTRCWALRRPCLAPADRKPSAAASRECSAYTGTLSVYTASHSLTARLAPKLS